jgi:hypothetical protein
MAAAEREARIIELRAHSVPFREIAKQVGLSVGRVHEIFHEACNRIPAEQLNTIRVRSRELADMAINDLLKIARDENKSPNARILAWTEIRQTDESQRKLFGADAPQRKEITVLTDDVIDSAIKKLTEEMEALDAQAELAVERLVSEDA